MNTKSLRPEDIVPDGVESISVNGKIVRKGTVAAFLANADVLENPTATEKQKQDAINIMKELAPDVVAVGLHKHVTFKNTEAEQLLVDAKLFLK